MSKVNEHNVELRVPVDESYVSVVRLLVSGLATRLGLPVTEIEKLKDAVGESFLTVAAMSEVSDGLMNLRWNQNAERVNVRISDPTGKHKSNLVNAANLALLKRLGGEYNAEVVDGISSLNIDFEISYRDNRPFLFAERPDGRA
jgi:hypothetical protein